MLITIGCDLIIMILITISKVNYSNIVSDFLQSRLQSGSGPQLGLSWPQLVLGAAYRGTDTVASHPRFG